MGNFYTDVISVDSRFHSTERVADIGLLEPVTLACVQAIIAQAQQQGIALMIFETYRSQERQQQLYDSGATHLQQVGVHHFGLACDIVKSVNGEASWKGDFTFLRDLATANGLISGMDWGQPDVKHTFIDSVHVQRCTVAIQPQLFAGIWYPDGDYNPYTAPVTPGV